MTLPTLIADIHARQILDSRGRPTVEAEMRLADGTFARACAPSGASRGRHEAWELRDREPGHYDGLGVRKAVANVNDELAKALRGADALDQSALDQRMCALDGTSSLERLGANAILAVSMAAARAAAGHLKRPLYRHLADLAGTVPSMPMPMTNILSGGAHAGRSMDIQDFLAIPVGADSYSQALEMIARVRLAATRLMEQGGLPVLLADEGGLSPGFAGADAAMELMVRSFEEAGLRPGEDVAIALDVAASELYAAGAYELAGEGRRFDAAAMSEFIVDLANRYPVVSIEDPLDQDDWSNWQTLTRRLDAIQIVGDDLFVTNVVRIRQGIDQGAANAVLIKLNQNGTVSGTLAAAGTARAAGYAAIVSARSGETEDTFIADLSVGLGAGQIKVGSVRSSERLAKYNELLRIEEAGLPFAGVSGLAGRPLARVG